MSRASVARARPRSASSAPATHPAAAPSLTPAAPAASAPPPQLLALQRGLVAAAASIVLALAPPGPPALALLNSPNALVPRSADAALRRSIPAFNPDVKAVQEDLERIQYKLRIPQRKPWAGMASDLAESEERAGSDALMLRGVLPADRATAESLLATLRSELARLSQAVARKDPDRTSIRAANALTLVAELELLQAPGLPYPVPAQYGALPRLTGRAVVELVVEKADGSAAFVEADSEEGPQKRATLQLVLDGYSAPLSAGTFAVNVLDGKYNGQRLSVTEGSVLAGEQGAGTDVIPLELLPAGDFEPRYRTPLDVRGGELPVLPLSIYGAVAFAHLPETDDASVGFVSSQKFFIYKYERQAAGLAGLSFDEGEFGVLGYVTRGQELLRTIGEGDRLVSARLVSGGDKLRRGGDAPGTDIE